MIAALLALALVPQTFTIVDNGHSDWVITGDFSVPAIRHGAEELQRFIKEISGAALEIVGQESQTQEPILARPQLFAPAKRALKHFITIRPDNEPEEHYTMGTAPYGISIRGGGKRGAMYGCYAFLQDVLGCRWYTRTVWHIPHKKTLAVGPLNIHGGPAFEYREPYFTEAFDGDWALRNRVNGNNMPLDESVGGKVSYSHFVHTFSELVPPDTYFKDHPEYFSLVNGKRQSGYAQLCLTNPDAKRIVVDKVKQWIRENPNATIFSVSQNDTYLNCQCDNCKKIELEEGSPSGPLLRFVNEVADEVGKEYPNVLIDTLAYQWSEKPPLHEKPHANVRVRLAPIDACFAHPLDGCEKNARSWKNLLDWERVVKAAPEPLPPAPLPSGRAPAGEGASGLYVWHYATNFSSYLQPLPDLDEISRDVKLFHDHGVVGLFYEGDYAPGGGGDMAELKSYLLARLMWDPSRNPKAVISEFLNAVYGRAAPDIQKWLNLVHEEACKADVHAGIFDKPTAPYLTAHLISEGNKIFDHAEPLVKGTQLDEVQLARMGLEYVELMQAAPADPRRAVLLRVLAEKIKRFGITQTSEGGSAEDFLKKMGGVP